MSEYEIVIKKLIPKDGWGFRYAVYVYSDRESDTGDHTWSKTLWGAHRAAKRLVKKLDTPEPKEEIIEKYKIK